LSFNMSLEQSKSFVKLQVAKEKEKGEESSGSETNLEEEKIKATV